MTDTTTATEPADTAASTTTTMRLLVSCPDRPGIVSAVSRFLFDTGANIIRSAQYSTDPSDGTFFLGCNNVNPTVNGDGAATYTFDAASLAVLNQVPFPTGTISAVDVLIDIEGTADLTNIMFNGTVQTPALGPAKKSDCKKGGWKSFTDPTFKNQGQCVSWFNHHNGHGKGTPSTDASTTTQHGKGKGKK